MVIQNLLLFLLVSIVHASNDCLSANCNSNGPIIQFPFWTQGTPQSCAPPGFKLSCNGHMYPILHISGSGDFYLKSVSYYKRRFVLQDVEGCLGQHLLSFDLSSSPFMAVEYRNYTFFSCPKGSMYSTVTTLVDCASNANSNVYAMDDPRESPRFSVCTEIANLPVPVSSSFRFPDDLELTWASIEVGKAKPSEFRSSAMILIIPIVILLVMVVGWVCMKKQGGHHNSSSSAIQISEVGGLRGRGLNKSTVETYRKITVGESSVEGPNGVACTICLADYATNEAIRFMPECEHCFHVECIDKWLSMSRKCPVCRISLPN